MAININELLAKKLSEVEQGAIPRPQTMKMFNEQSQPKQTGPQFSFTPDQLKEMNKAMDKSHTLDVVTPDQEKKVQVIAKNQDPTQQVQQPQPQAQGGWVQDLLGAIPGIAKGAMEFAGKPEGFKTFAALNSDPYMKEALLNRGNEMEKTQQEAQQLQKKFEMEKALKQAEAGMKPEFSTYGTQPVMIGGQYFIPQVGKKIDASGNPEIRMVPLPQGAEYATTEQAPENLELKDGRKVVATYDKGKNTYVSDGKAIPLSDIRAKGLSASTIINVPKEPVSKKIPAGIAMDIADLKSSVDLLNNFDTQIDSITDKGLFNPFTAVPRTATIGGVNVADATNDTEARKYVSAITLLKQIVAKGLEGGVLRQEDTKKYDKILGSAGASKAALKDISKEIRTMIRVKEKNNLNTLESAGYDVKDISRIGNDNKAETRKIFVDDKGNKAYQNPDGSFEEIK